MENKIQPRPGDGADEATIEKNLAELNYPSGEDVMSGGRVVQDHPTNIQKPPMEDEQPPKEK